MTGRLFEAGKRVSIAFCLGCGKGDRIATRKIEVCGTGLNYPAKNLFSVSCFGIENFEVALGGRLRQFLV